MQHKLEAIARRYTSPYWDVIRAKIVLYAAMGLDNDASWLNQVEIYFSTIQRKVLDPNGISSLDELKEIRLLGFQKHYEAAAQPSQWKFTRQNLRILLGKIETGPDIGRHRE